MASRQVVVLESFIVGWLKAKDRGDWRRCGVVFNARGTPTRMASVTGHIISCGAGKNEMANLATLTREFGGRERSHAKARRRKWRRVGREKAQESQKALCDFCDSLRQSSISSERIDGHDFLASFVILGGCRGELSAGEAGQFQSRDIPFFQTSSRSLFLIGIRRLGGYTKRKLWAVVNLHQERRLMNQACCSRAAWFATGDRRLGVTIRFLLPAIVLFGFLNAKASAVQVTVDASSSAAVEYFANTPRESFVRFFGNDRSLFSLGQNEFDLTLGVPATFEMNYLQLSVGANDAPPWGSLDVETHTISYTATVGSQSAEIVYDISAKLVSVPQFQFDYHLISPETVRFWLSSGQFLDFSPLPKGSAPLGQVNENNRGRNAAIFWAQLTLGVPEPSVGVLLGFGGAFAFAPLRRRQRV